MFVYVKYHEISENLEQIVLNNIHKSHKVIKIWAALPTFGSH